MVEAWWDRNSAIGAWQYSSARCDTREYRLGPLPRTRSQGSLEPVRLFRWRNYRDYGTGVAGDLFVHLFSGMHFVTGAIGPTRVYATAACGFWKMAATCPTSCSASMITRPPDHHRIQCGVARQLRHGASENSGFRFVGSEGILTSTRRERRLKDAPRSSPLHHRHLSQIHPEQFLKDYRRIPADPPQRDSIRAQSEEKVSAARPLQRPPRPPRTS